MSEYPDWQPLPGNPGIEYWIEEVKAAGEPPRLVVHRPSRLSQLWRFLWGLDSKPFFEEAPQLYDQAQDTGWLNATRPCSRYVTALPWGDDDEYMLVIYRRDPDHAYSGILRLLEKKEERNDDDDKQQ